MTLLVIDLTQIWVAAIGGFFSLASLIVTLLLRGKVATVDTKVDSYKKEVDGIKTELVAAVRGQYQAEGELKGKADQKIIERSHQDEINTALKTMPPESEKPVEVKIVDQAKPVEVTNKPKK